MQSKGMGIDRISALPDPVLHHILSMNTTRHSVQTSILSQRWRHLWTSIPTLHFDQREFLASIEDSEQFIEFVEKVLILCGDDDPLSVMRFHLIMADHMSEYFVHRWFEFAVSRKVQEFDCILYADGKQFGHDGWVPNCLFTCSSLRCLKLTMGHRFLQPIHSIDLRGLKTMHLTGIVSHNNSLNRLISSCPVLEELLMKACDFDELHICAPELRSLTVSGCNYYSYNKIVISTPKLLSFNYSSGKVQGCFLDNMTSLVNANCMLFKLRYSGSSDTKWSVDEILRGLYHAKHITLTYLDIEHLSVERDLLGRLPIFDNLKYLKLNTYLNKDQILAITYILQHTPNLETLVICNEGMSFQSIPNEKGGCGISENLPCEFLNHLKEVELRNFGSSEYELEFVKYLKRNAMVLEKFTLSPRGSPSGRGPDNSIEEDCDGFGEI